MQRQQVIAFIETGVQAGLLFLIFMVLTEVMWPGFVSRIVPVWWPIGVEILLTLLLARMRRP